MLRKPLCSGVSVNIPPRSPANASARPGLMDQVTVTRTDRRETTLERHAAACGRSNSERAETTLSAVGRDDLKLADFLRRVRDRRLEPTAR